MKKAGFWEILMLRFGWRELIAVEGDSMLPTLSNGDRILIKHRKNAALSDIVVARHPFKTSVFMVKRVAEIDERGNFVLLGDNPLESTDSRTLGNFPPELILGIATAKF